MAKFVEIDDMWLTVITKLMTKLQNGRSRTTKKANLAKKQSALARSQKMLYHKPNERKYADHDNTKIIIQQ